MSASAPTLAPRHRTQNRFEVKCLVATAQVPSLIDEIAPYIVADRHAGPRQGYPVSSVYWDTPTMAFFREKVEGVGQRRKLRFRRYGDADDVFVEVKERDDRTLHKRRLRWPLERVVGVFGDDGIGGVDWDAVGDDPVAVEVALMIDRLRLAPRMGVRYQRRAFGGAFDPELRISFDSRLMYRPAPVSLSRPFDIGRYIIDPRVTVLEFKYDHRAPLWLTKLVCRRGLKMVRMSKYCSAVDRHYFGGQNT